VNIHIENNVIIQIVGDIICNGVVIQKDKSVMFPNKYICEILLYIKNSLHDKVTNVLNDGDEQHISNDNKQPISNDNKQHISNNNNNKQHISNDCNNNRIPIHIEKISPLYTRNIYASTIIETTNITTYQLSNVCVDYCCHNYTSLWLHWHKIINALISSSVIDNVTNKYNFELKKELDSIYSTIDKEFNKSFTDGVQTYLEYQKYNHVCVTDTSCSICNDFGISCGHLIKLLISKLNQRDCNVIKLNTLLL